MTIVNYGFVGNTELNETLHEDLDMVLTNALAWDIIHKVCKP